MDPLNTHNYDGKIDIKLIPELSKISTLSIEEKKCKCYEIKEIAEKTFDKKSIHFLDGIINSIGTDLNIDYTNGLIADDLLYLCWYYKENEDFMSELETQLSDMSTGFCQQGRTHRLFQLLVAFN